MIEINLNEYAWVKLTEKGKKAYREHYSYVWGLLKREPHDPPTDSNGWSKFQIWNLLEIFGPDTELGREEMFYPLVFRFDPKNFEVVETV